MFTYLFTDDKCKVPKGAGMEVGEEGDYVLSLHGQKQNDSCIKTGSDESHFKVSFIVRNKVTRQCPQTTTF